MSVKSEMTRLADALRSKSGATGLKSIEELADIAENLSVGIELPKMSNPSASEDLMHGMEMIDQEGKIVEGTFSLDEELLDQNVLIDQLMEEVVGKAIPELPKLANQATAADLRYGMELIGENFNVVTGTMPDNELSTPTISVDAAGRITATVTQPTGYVEGATKSAMSLLSTQAGYAITPNSTTQIAVAAHKYTTGAVTVNPVPSSYVQPSGTLSVTANGTYDVTSKASVSVNVSSGPAAGTVVKGWYETNVTIASGSTARVNYGSAVVNSNGEVAFSSYTQLSVSSLSALDIIKGRYAQRGSTSTMTTSTYPIYYIPTDATFSESGSAYSKTYTVSKAYPMFVYGDAN